MSKLRIVEMDHIVLNVSDVERSIAFYAGVLGLAAERVEEFRAGKVGFPSVRINEHTLIDLMRADRVEQTQRNLNHFCLVSEATDLDALADDLESHGVTIVRRPVSRWGARGQAMSIYILDPDANEIEIRCY
jgi:extradiol dioxygenase family protein